MSSSDLSGPATDTTATPARARPTPNSDNYAPATTPQTNRSASNLASTSTRTLNGATSSANMAQSSPSTTRAAAGGSGGSTITVESALALSGGSYETALAQLVEERNSIQAQNTMLWKHIEKIKLSAAGLKKDLDRVRGERDRVVDRLRALSGTGTGESEQRARPPVQRSGSVDTVTTPAGERPTLPLRHMSDAGAHVLLVSPYSLTH